MKWTNRLNLPPAYAEAVSRDWHHAPGQMSVTQLLLPPRLWQLVRRHDAELERDVADWSSVSAFLGTGMHKLLEGGAPEKILSADCLGWRITGTPDYYDAESQTLTDWKLTSVWQVVMSDQTAWEQQTNLYAELLRREGRPVQRVQVVAVFRDWQRSKAMKEPDYPRGPVQVVRLPLWGPSQAGLFLEERVRIHQRAAAAAESELALCDAKERWERPATWAVTKPGLKRSMRNFTVPRDGQDAEAQANRYAQENNAVVVYRQGESIRCLDWCVARHVCDFGRSLAQEQAGEAE